MDILFDETQVTLKHLRCLQVCDILLQTCFLRICQKIFTTYTSYSQAKPCGKPRGSSTGGFEKEKGDGGGGEGVFLKGCARQLLLRQLLMSIEQQLAEIPEDTLPASSQMEGLGLEGHRG